VRRLVEPVMPELPVLSLAELPITTNLRSMGVWEVSHAA
jgi:flagellar biosynthesis component FlhA